MEFPRGPLGDDWPLLRVVNFELERAREVWASIYQVTRSPSTNLCYNNERYDDDTAKLEVLAVVWLSPR